MVSTGLTSLFVLAIAAVAKAATTFTVPIAYNDEITVGYYFRENNDAVSITTNDQGLQITVDAPVDKVCEILDSGMVIYDADHAGVNTLLSWNQYDVFHLVDSTGVEFKYTSTNSQACPVAGPVSSSAASGSSSGSTSTASQTATAGSSSFKLAPSTTMSVVTTTESGVVTEYTTYCPYITANRLDNVVTYASAVTTTNNGQVSVYTTFFPVKTQLQASATATGIPATAAPSMTVVTTTINGAKIIYTTTCPLTQTTAANVDSYTSVVTTTVSGKETVYTTVCPLTTGAQTTSVVTTTVNGMETVYTTVCPLTSAAQTTSVVTTTVNGQETVYTTVCPLTTGAQTTTAVTTTQNGKQTVYTSTVPLPTTGAPQSLTTQTITTSENGHQTAYTTVRAASSAVEQYPGSSSSTGLITTYQGAAAAQPLNSLFAFVALLLGSVVVI